MASQRFLQRVAVTMSRLVAAGVLTLALLPGGLAAPAPARAAATILDVDTTSDLGDPAHQACSPDPSDCSLRGALVRASFGDYEIRVPAGHYDLGSALSIDGTPALWPNLTIVGAGADLTVIDGNLFDRVFHISGSAHVEIRDLTIQKGRSPDATGSGSEGTAGTSGAAGTDGGADQPGGTGGDGTAGGPGGAGNAGEDGGGIYNTGTLTLTNVVVEDSQAGSGSSGGQGGLGGNGGDGGKGGSCSNWALGAVAYSGGRGGTGGTSGAGGAGGVGGNGGGIYNAGTLTLVSSTVRDNAAGQGGVGGTGGVFELFPGASTSAIGGDGGLPGGLCPSLGQASGAVGSEGGTGGRGGDGGIGGRGGHGGGIYNVGSLTIEDSQLEGNHAGTGGTGGPGSKGGIGGWAGDGGGDAFLVTYGGLGGTGGDGGASGYGGQGGDGGDGGAIHSVAAVSISDTALSANDAGAGGLGGDGGTAGSGGRGGNGGLGWAAYPGGTGGKGGQCWTYDDYSGLYTSVGCRGGAGGTGGRGGGISISSAGTLDLSQGTLVQNTAGRGGQGGNGGQGGHGGKGGDGASTGLSCGAGGDGGDGSDGGESGPGGDGGWGGGLYNASADASSLSESEVSENSSGSGYTYGDGGDGGLGGEGGVHGACLSPPADGSPGSDGASFTRIGDGGDGGSVGGIYNVGALTLSDVGIAQNTSGAGGDGYVSSAAGGVGGIYNTGALDAQSVTLESNVGASGGADTGSRVRHGGTGGIYNSGDVTLAQSIVRDNTGGDGGEGRAMGGGLSGINGGAGGVGGIDNTGTLTITGSTLTGNTGGAGGDGHNGGAGGDGGIDNAGAISVIDSTLTGNTGGAGNATLGTYNAQGNGNGGHGGSGGANNDGEMTLVNVTVHLNAGAAGAAGASAFSWGNRGGHGGTGGVRNSGQLHIENVTLSQNSGGDGGDTGVFDPYYPNTDPHIAGDAGSGGVQNRDSGSIEFVNAILAHNTAGAIGEGRTPTPAGGLDGQPAGPDCGGSVDSQDYNLVKDTTNCAIAGAVDHNLYGQDPLLGALADNGGPTQTQALLAGSPAIDAGGSADAPAADQRGVPRPQGLAIDMGAFETQPVLSLSKQVDDEAPVPGQRITYTIVVSNPGAVAVVGGIVSDTLPDGLTSAGPVTLEPPSAGTTGTPPSIVSDLSVGVGETVTVTVPISVNIGLAGGTLITNTAAVSYTGALEWASSEIGIVVAKGRTTAARESSLNPSVIGQAVTFTVTVEAYPPALGTPTGVVTFSIDSAAIPVTLEAGVATYVTSTLAAGDHPLSAEYGGDASFSGVHARPLTQQVLTPDLRIAKAVSDSGPVPGQLITYTIVISNAGDAAATNGAISETLAAGQTFAGPVTLDPPGAGTPGAPPAVVTGLTVGVGETVTVTVPVSVNVGLPGGTTIDNQAAVNCAERPDWIVSLNAMLTVEKGDTTTSLSLSQTPLIFGQPVTLTAQVAPASPALGVPGGQVQFQIDGADFGSPMGLIAGVATSGVISTLAPGTHTFRAEYLGDDSFTASADELTQQTVVRLKLKKTADRDTVPAGWVIHYTIRVTNDSSATLSRIVVTDTLPGGTRFVTAFDGGVRSGNQIVWRLRDVPPGAWHELHVDVGTYTTFRGVIANMATAAANGFSVSVRKLVRVVAP